MNYSLVVHDEAVADIREAYKWYENKSLGLGDEFLEEIENCYTLITENPLHYGFVNDKFRRIKVARFPYRIIYEVTSKEVIIYGVDHVRQDRRH